MSAPDSTHLSAPGARLGGRYEIVALLGTGGMGAVYKAIDHELEETVALKMLRPELASDPEMLERFRREVKLARRVTHRNVARVFDIGDHGQQKFLTMELVVGESLDDRLTRQGALSPAEAVDLLLALCEGLAAAHEVGIVHRDLKPANVILHQSGRPVITDFGIAKPTGNEAIKLTQGPNMILGTPAYMAPEQVEGGPVDQRADLYALGAMAFELLTGQLPFEAKTPLSLAAARLTQSPRSLRALVPTVSTMIEQIVMRCLERDPGRRFEDARAVSAALEAAKANAALATGVPMARVAADAPTQMGPAPTVLRASPTAVFGQHHKTLAVLPFENRSAPEDAFMAEGLTEDLRDALSMTAGLRVTAQSSLAPFLGQTPDLARLASELGVDVCVEGSFRRVGKAVRVNVRLLHAGDGLQVWARRFDCSSDEALLVSDQAASAIAGALALEQPGAPRHLPADSGAVELYLRARSEYQRGTSGLDQTVHLFQQAAALAPDNPAILSGMALAMARMWFQQGRGGDDVKQAVERALAVAPSSPEARLALAAARFQGGDAVAALHEALRTIALAPGLSEAHLILGRVLSEAGATAAACRAFEVALMLDPGQEVARWTWARTVALDGRLAEANALLEGGNPDRTLWQSRALIRARIALWYRDDATALELADRIVAAGPVTAGTPAGLAIVLATLVRSKKMPQTLFMDHFTRQSDNSRRVAFMTQLHAEAAGYLNDDEATLEHLRASSGAGLLDSHWLERCPLLDRIRAASEFGPIRAEVKARADEVLAAYASTAQSSALGGA